jgi:membrane protease subunit (stomatin/prohibitin family)
MGIRYSSLPAHTVEISDALNQVLSTKWTELRGLAVASFGVNSVTASKEDEDLIKQLQRTAVMRDPNMAAAHIVSAQSDAMRTAAGNSAGAFTGFMGMGMAQQSGGINADSLFQMGQQNRQYNNPPPAPAPAPAPVQQPAANGWTCSCGAVNKGKFCAECGSPKPAGAALYRCDKCGWEPADPARPPKFCPECGDVFDARDLK